MHPPKWLKEKKRVLHFCNGKVSQRLKRANFGKGYKRKSVYFTFVTESELLTTKWAFVLKIVKREKACTRLL